MYFFFFFQAEDGIRDKLVTGVQTCALPISDALTTAVLAGGLHAVLDVTSPEVLPADSPLYDHDNVLLTPHIAGSLGTELARMGALAVDEITRLAAGEPLAHPVLEEHLGRTA